MASHKDRLLTHISTAQAQDTGIAAAEHTADDISQDACTHLGLVERTKDSEQLVKKRTRYRARAKQNGDADWFPWAQIL